jgi:hypothetical protein
VIVFVSLLLYVKMVLKKFCDFVDLCYCCPCNDLDFVSTVGKESSHEINNVRDLEHLALSQKESQCQEYNIPILYHQFTLITPNGKPYNQDDHILGIQMYLVSDCSRQQIVMTLSGGGKS